MEGGKCVENNKFILPKLVFFILFNPVCEPIEILQNNFD